MKPDIHPKYHQATVHCGSCGTEFEVGSTRETLRVEEADCKIARFRCRVSVGAALEAAFGVASLEAHLASMWRDALVESSFHSRDELLRIVELEPRVGLGQREKVQRQREFGDDFALAQRVARVGGGRGSHVGWRGPLLARPLASTDHVAHA